MLRDQGIAVRFPARVRVFFSLKCSQSLSVAAILRSLDVVVKRPEWVHEHSHPCAKGMSGRMLPLSRVPEWRVDG